MNNKKKTCFIITPIGEEKSDIRRHIEGIIDSVVDPVLENDYEIKVAHRLFQAGSINKQIINLIYESDLVIANLTQTNPNVMYELAFRHTLGLPTITMAEANTKLPFDISSERTIFYKNDMQGVKEAKEELKKYICQIDYDSGKTTGPIHDYLDSVELKNLIFSHNRNKNTSEILDLIVKRLEGIENSIPNLKKEITSEFVDDILKTAIKQTPDLNVAKLNMSVSILNEKMRQINNIINDVTDDVLDKLNSLSLYINNNTSKDSVLVSSRTLIYRLITCADVLKRCQTDIQNIIYND